MSTATKASALIAKNAAAAAAAAANAAADGDEDEDMCLVCCEPLEFVAIGQCNHQVCCALCASRMRILMNDSRCVLCKTDHERVFVTADKSKEFESFQTWGDVGGPGLVFDGTSNMFFDEGSGAGEEKDRIEALRGFRCNKKGCMKLDEDFGSYEKLGEHMLKAHGERLCQQCCESRGVFPMEQARYTKREYNLHVEKGEQGTAFRGHPQCRFCKTRFYNNDALYQHLKEKHENCFVCHRQGKQFEYYRDYKSLYQHFQKHHYVCTQPACLEAKFVVFETEVELRGHIIETHPNIKVDRTVPVNFTVKRSGFGGSGIEDYGARDDGARGAGGEQHIETMDFRYVPGQDNFPSPRASTGPSFQAQASPGSLSSASAFPGLRESAQEANAFGAGSAGNQYSSVLGFTGSRSLADPEAFPSLGGGAGGRNPNASPLGYAGQRGASFRGAMDTPVSALGNFAIQRKGKGKKGKGKKNWAESEGPTFAPALSREEQQMAAIRANTQRSLARSPAPVPAPAPAPAPRQTMSSMIGSSRRPTPAMQNGYAPVHNSQDAAQRVLNHLEGVLDAGNFVEFQEACGMYNRNQVNAEAYYRHIDSLLPPGELDSIFDLLIQSLPSQGKAAELKEVRARRSGASNGTQRGGHASGTWNPQKGPRPGEAAKADFPSLPKSSGPKFTVGSAVSEWEALQKSGKIKSGVSLGVKKPSQGKKKKQANKKKNDVFFFGL